MEVVEQLTPVTAGERRRWLDRLGDLDAHRRAVEDLAALHEVEVRPASRPHEPGDGPIRIAAWNVERGTHLDGLATVLERERPDLCLLGELDVGMARSGNRHVPAALAQRLDHSVAFAVEFVELGLGDRAETDRLAPDAVNDAGFHGNAITTSGSLDDVALLRIETDGAWFDDGIDQPRVGGRVALAARVTLGGRELVACTVHLESESDPGLRAAQLEIVLDALDDRYGTGPAVVGGDLNTFSAGIDELRAPGGHSTRHAEDPSRWCWPVRYEPLFAVAADHGFAHETANLAESTMRLAADQEPNSLLRLDWLLVRGLEASRPVTVPAVDPDGAVLSDHDLVLATILPA